MAKKDEEKSGGYVVHHVPSEKDVKGHAFEAYHEDDPEVKGYGETPQEAIDGIGTTKAPAKPKAAKPKPSREAAKDGSSSTFPKARDGADPDAEDGE
jgi:hypothetical protein